MLFKGIESPSLRGWALAILALILAAPPTTSPAESEARPEETVAGASGVEVISSAFRPSGSTGGRIRAVVSSERPVSHVEADLGELGIVTLIPDEARGGVSEDRTRGIWSAEWTDLPGAPAPGSSGEAITITVTDREGGTHEAVAKIEPGEIAGIATPGTANYPNGGLRRLDRELFVTEYDLETAVIDPENGYAYFGTRTSPGRVVKVDLGSGSNPPRRVGAVSLNDGEDELVSSVIDIENGYAYFGTNTSPGTVVKVALGEGDEPPRRVGAVMLLFTEPGSGPIPSFVFISQLTAAVIDPESGYAYFGTNTTPARIAKIALGEGAAPPTRVGYLELPEEESNLVSAVIDTDNGHAFFGAEADGDHTKVVKVGLGSGESPPFRIGSANLYLIIGDLFIREGIPTSAVIDPDRGYAWFGTDYGKVVKIALGDGLASPTLAASSALLSQEKDLRAAAIDPDSGYAYFALLAGETDPAARLVKVALGEGNDSPSRVASHEVSGDGPFGSLVMDAAGGHLYTGNMTAFPGIPSRVRKFAAGTGNASPFPLGSVSLQSTSPFSLTGTGFENQLVTALHDPGSGHIYFGTGSSVGRVAKLRTAGPEGLPQRTGGTQFPDGGVFGSPLGAAQSGVIDTENGYAYFGTDTSPASIAKVRLGDGEDPPEYLNSIELPTGFDDLRAAAIDPANGYAYFGTYTNPGRVVKIALGEGDDPPTHVATRTLSSGESYLSSAIIDTENGYLYFGTSSDPARVVKLIPGTGDSAPTRLGSTAIQNTFSPEGGAISAAFDPRENRGYFGMDSSPGVIVGVDLGTGSSLPPNSGSQDLSDGEDHVRALVIDLEDDRLYAVTDTNPGRVVAFEINRHDIILSPTRLGSISLPSAEEFPASAVADTEEGMLYVGTDGTSRAVRIAMGQKGFLKGTRLEMPEDGRVDEMRLYTHNARGNVRLSLYSDDEPRELLWHSGPVAADTEGGELAVPISEGTPPALTLPAGDYWLAWQTDTTVPVASYHEGENGEGFLMPLSFRDPPASLDPGAGQQTTETWTQYIVYTETLPGDFNGDGCVNFQDFAILLDNWGGEHEGTAMDFGAFADLLNHWGEGCT